ncbi:hypothetical protein HER10_EVM0011159 [Colletotrichum scovillei]|uniref:Uncharacterized protein n=2 Tax=Colletotrichum acutatum species complex TaxID=2707335 RepID=A0A9P7QSA0_9PEZI|nr:uncharacterized protein HER10_EVM0011159 [Colletotrichum scovillei]KXH45624.1 hypothetical protein CSIM01_09693 [Colletotrichum simmondsii]KAF4775496.1 hypothetical protein HER10_EVM0011159 [Colletotrichum scovillei]KAG7039450.1 hypothetical protein JMJ78_0001200 [Colletotrichum scovillei]KAG7041627.1 hypothetical protein JMJ77_0012147 [Colletotrichum scovillei]KAG7061654.1 hypothetical protein JMJ76_0003614 [Colletotrichum scovillei]
MQFSIAKVASLFVLLSVASADLHDNCACDNGDSYNWRITTKACELYASKNYQWGKGTYNTETGRCVQNSASDQLAGKEWEAACREIASTGFDCADGKGLYCKANPDEVRGRC